MNRHSIERYVLAANVHREKRAIGQFALPSAQRAGVHLVTAADVATPVTRTIGHTFAR